MSLRSGLPAVQANRQLEGAGFEVRRPFPARGLSQFDPFLLLDHMGPKDNRPGEAEGAPDHPHRGFETVTYLLEGSMVHSDSVGNKGRLNPGDVQWMTAGSGVVHCELPSQELMEKGGRLHGFQLWVNLPRKDKMIAPRYQDTPSEKIPVAQSGDGLVRAKVIAGEALGKKAVIETRTPIFYIHFAIQPGGQHVQPAPSSYNTFAYVVSGNGTVAGVPAAEGQWVRLRNDGDAVELRADASAKQAFDLLLIGGEPLNEPMARYGPFVMNTQEEIAQAFDDYQSGRFGKIDAARR